MPEPERLERRLRELGPALEYPATPDLRRAVERRLRPRFRRRGWWAAAAAVLIAAGALALLPPVRVAVAQWLGLGRVRVERVQNPPSAAPRPAGDAGERLHLGRAVSLDEARDLLGGPVPVPTALGAPDAVYWAAGTRFVSLVYLPRPGLPETAGSGVGVLLMEAAGDVQYPFLGKLLGPQTTLEPADVDGAPGAWLAGAPHAVAYLDPSGRFTTDDVRLVGNVLIWSRAGLTYRIESGLTRERALAIATTLR